MELRHCCGNCDFYNPGQMDSENWGRCEWFYQLMRLETVGLTPEDGEGCKAWRLRGFEDVYSAIRKCEYQFDDCDGPKIFSQAEVEKTFDLPPGCLNDPRPPLP